MKMVPPYTARNEDLASSDFVKVVAQRARNRHCLHPDSWPGSASAHVTRCSTSRIGRDVDVRRARSHGRADQIGEVGPLRPLSIAERKEPVNEQRAVSDMLANLIRYAQFPWRDPASVPGLSGVCCDGIQNRLRSSKRERA
jgi:hypothetical protein